MKKFLLALAIGGASLLSFNSCTKEYITNENFLPGVSYVYDINPNNWSLSGDTYSYTIPIGDLDDVYFEDGHVNVSITYLNSGVYQNIPATISNYNFRANYSVGSVTIFADEVGTTPQITPPAALKVKIVLTDAAIGN
ncbi:hypothetical protein [Sphingobacterium hungaricum]|uniref:DUF1735 domain-containing protein n=1 Tax=Sphingobacterium hungaricum TaxID=2082723 RepID=A0A928YRW8_9SPHI|nr:hypothetical protein [Sphingobacterium hungaricum]MBE8714615.1 hypothetical protein [Sphingobacterium hungaricum]